MFKLFLKVFVSLVIVICSDANWHLPFYSLSFTEFKDFLVYSLDSSNNLRKKIFYHSVISCHLEMLRLLMYFLLGFVILFFNFCLQQIADALCSILLLEDSTPRQVFNEFLLARTVSIILSSIKTK